jgi:glucosamine--fructose-6-phosphate aminotransferase (isomerizing)
MSTAKEGTLKVMETNALAASDWSVADAAHGPLGQVTARTPVVVLTASPCELESVATFSAAAPDLWAEIVVVGQHQFDPSTRVREPVRERPTEPASGS